MRKREFAAPVLHRVVPEGGSRHGLVIGIDKYQEQRLNLRCAAADAQAMYDVMVDEACGVFPKENVTLLLDEQATRREVGRALSSLARKVGLNDTVWIYYAGHGAVEGDEAYWVTHDADVNHLSTTGLERSLINRELSRLACDRVMLLLDCCHAAATALQHHALRAKPSAEQLFGKFEGKGVMTLAASDGSQKSVELMKYGRGAFTYYLEKGLRGEADDEGNRDGVVTLEELWKYLHKRVEAEALRSNNKQTPVKYGSMTGDDMALTLNARIFEQADALIAVIESLVGIRPGQLRTEQGKYCVTLLHRLSRTEKEKDVVDALEEVLRGELPVKRFLPIVELAMREEIRPAEPATVIAVPALQVVPAKTEPAKVISMPVPPEVTPPKTSNPWIVDVQRTDKFGMWTEFALGNVVQRMRWIPPGTFIMGSPKNDEERFDDEVQHRVTLTQGFWLGETPVTQALWQVVMGANPSKFKDLSRPVETVSWGDCQKLLERINREVSGGGLRLPTEAEWEYACRAGTATATWIGNLKIHNHKAPELDAIAWYSANSGGETHPVKQKAPNPWGLYDMLGNLYEWCSDWSAAYDVRVELDPQGPAEGSSRIMRGGSWSGGAKAVRAAYRFSFPPVYRYDGVGFRLARDAVPTPQK
jgi:formylglycine-generating enzyme required for sulfatase activity